MRKKITTFVLLITFAVVFTNCYTHNHVIGNGSTGKAELSEKQWYILWGLVPLNTINTNKMAGNVQDYQITTQHSFVDVLISAVTGIATIGVKSVTVKK